MKPEYLVPHPHLVSSKCLSLSDYLMVTFHSSRYSIQVDSVNIFRYSLIARNLLGMYPRYLHPFLTNDHYHIIAHSARLVSRATALRHAPIPKDLCMKSRRKGDLFLNASVVVSCVTPRRCTPSALARRVPPSKHGKSLTGSLERSVSHSQV